MRGHARYVPLTGGRAPDDLRMSLQESPHRSIGSHTATTALLTVNEAAHLLTVSKPTVRRLADRGDLPRVRIGPGGRLVRFRLTDVQALMVPTQSESPATNEASAKTPSPPAPHGQA